MASPYDISPFNVGYQATIQNQNGTDPMGVLNGLYSRSNPGSDEQGESYINPGAPGAIQDLLRRQLGGDKLVYRNGGKDYGTNLSTILSGPLSYTNRSGRAAADQNIGAYNQLVNDYMNGTIGFAPGTPQSTVQTQQNANGGWGAAINTPSGSSIPVVTQDDLNTALQQQQQQLEQQFQQQQQTAQQGYDNTLKDKIGDLTSQFDDQAKARDAYWGALMNQQGGTVAGGTGTGAPAQTGQSNTPSGVRYLQPVKQSWGGTTLMPVNNYQAQSSQHNRRAGWGNAISF